MEDLIDLIRQTEDHVIGYRVNLWLFFGTITLIALFAFIASFNNVHFSRALYLRRASFSTFNEVNLHPLQRMRTDLYPPVTLLIVVAGALFTLHIRDNAAEVAWPGIASMLAPFLLLNVFYIWRTNSWLKDLDTQAHEVTGLIDEVPPEHHSRTFGLAVEKNLIVKKQRDLKILRRIAVIASSLAVAACIPWMTFPAVQAIETVPTSQAEHAGSNAISDINRAVEDAYDVEVIGENTCDHIDIFEDDSAVEAQERIAEYVEEATSGDPDKAPGIRVLTPNGVVGCYQVLYDREKIYDGQAARLIVTDEDTQLPLPGDILR